MSYIPETYTDEEVSRIKDLFDEDETRFGCGYWGVCLEHDCPCHPDAPVSKGFNMNIYKEMSEILSLASDEISDMESGCNMWSFDGDYWDDWDGWGQCDNGIDLI